MCEICGDVIKSAYGKGGHMSKKHPGMSKKYQNMLTKREENEGPRLLNDLVNKYMKPNESGDFRQNYSNFNHRRNHLKKKIIAKNTELGLDPYDLENAAIILTKEGLSLPADQQTD